MYRCAPAVLLLLSERLLAATASPEKEHTNEDARDNLTVHQVTTTDDAASIEESGDAALRERKTTCT
eukprot:3894587-Amphidinium_carterae.1